ncbi:hypothetical protein SAMN04487843_125108 [Methylobacterium sp. ap11]|jgi:hypothetical protein|uniref:hypothetical protein n=1 Tax=Methylobacterium sp. ap11 TaxID=1761799 RepID=UPI0008B973FF|nr:hypothetical protein [Methylobacterium sp. ap11]SEP47793.1 hypothetical protein SAMN04487843_125108 [Methylobacterium sp. ap11]
MPLVSLDRQTLVRALQSEAELSANRTETVADIVFRSQPTDSAMNFVVDPSKVALRGDIRSTFVAAKTDIIMMFVGAIALQTVIVILVIDGLVSILKP